MLAPGCGPGGKFEAHTSRMTSVEPTTWARAAELVALRERIRRGPGAEAAEARCPKSGSSVRDRTEPVLDEGRSPRTGVRRRYRAPGFGPRSRGPHTGGADVGRGPARVRAGSHNAESGAGAFPYDAGGTGLGEVRLPPSTLPRERRELPPAVRCDDPRERGGEAAHDPVPANPARARETHGAIGEPAHSGEYSEVSAEWARDVVGVLARTGGITTGVVANRLRYPAYASGWDAGRKTARPGGKAARFAGLRDAFGIPPVTPAGAPGFLAGTAGAQHTGAVRTGAELRHAHGDARVPRIRAVETVGAEGAEPPIRTHRNPPQ